MEWIDNRAHQTVEGPALGGSSASAHLCIVHGDDEPMDLVASGEWIVEGD